MKGSISFSHAAEWMFFGDRVLSVLKTLYLKSVPGITKYKIISSSVQPHFFGLKISVLSLELQIEELGTLILWKVHMKTNEEDILIYAHLFTLEKRGFYP
ncbi:hypothetical protein AV530_016976 [Patagioenas fasciata monilis]|uniref:Uncharacterized protein n=1 Tax=Patagioenas fasciata monilis TaxID=372326 RepID=A0A1V4J497_PATFA|nr:hypothetical protein AV530_016976 [Patagioenas fasciata monilis]